MAKHPRILYFIASPVPTAEETADSKRFGNNVAFRNINFAEGGLELCDGVAGKVPEHYAKKFPDAATALASHGVAVEQTAPAPVPQEPEMLVGSSVQPSTWTLTTGQVVQLAQVVAEAQRRSGLTPAQWNAQDNQQRENLIAAVVAELPLPQAGG